MNKYLLLIGGWLWTATALAQPTLRPLAPVGSAFQPSTCWQVQLDNPGGQTLRVYLTAQLSDQEDRRVWEGRSEAFLLPPEGRRFEAGSLPTAEEAFVDAGAELPTGMYMLCYRLYAEDFEQELARNCVPRRVLNMNLEQLGLPKLEKKFSFSGQARLSGQYADMPQLYSGASAKYARLEASPSVNVMGIPLQSRIYLSTEDKSLRYDVNTINLSFDVNQFQQNLTQRLQQKLKAEGEARLREKVQVLRDSLYNRARQKLGPKVAYLESGDMQKKLEELRDLERIEEMLKMPAYQEFQKRWEPYAQLSELELEALEDSLQRTNPRAYQRLQKLYSQYETFDRVLERKEDLEHQAEQLKKVLRLREQLEELESLKTGNLQQFAKDPKLYKKLGLFKRGEALMSSFKKLGIGSVFPYHSPLSVNGVALRGVDVETEWGGAYMALSAGKLMQTAFAFDSLPQQGAPRHITALRAGWGSREENHLHAMALFATGDSLNTFVGQADNRVLGLEGKLDFLQKKGQLEGEIMSSISHLEPTAFLQQNLTPWDSLRNAQGLVEGMAWRVRMDLQATPQTQVQARYEQVDPGYYSAGAPLLMRDRLRYQVQVKQRFFKRKLELGAFLRRDQNALGHFPQNILATRSMGLTLNLRMPNMPYVMINYAPFTQTAQLGDSLLNQRNTGMFNMSSGYQYTLGKVSASSTLMFVRQQATASDSVSQFIMEQVQYSQIFSLATHSLSLRVILGKQIYAERTEPILGFSGSLGSTFENGLSLSAGANYFRNSSENLNQQSSLFVQANKSFGRQISADLSLQHYMGNSENPILQRPRHPLLQASISYRW